MTKEARNPNNEYCSHRPVSGRAETRTAHRAVATAYSRLVIISSFACRAVASRRRVSRLPRR